MCLWQKLELCWQLNTAQWRSYWRWTACRWWISVVRIMGSESCLLLLMFLLFIGRVPRLRVHVHACLWKPPFSSLGLVFRPLEHSARNAPYPKQNYGHAMKKKAYKSQKQMHPKIS
jgi:hypothetical protein